MHMYAEIPPGSLRLFVVVDCSHGDGLEKIEEIRPEQAREKGRKKKRDGLGVELHPGAQLEVPARLRGGFSLLDLKLTVAPTSWRRFLGLAVVYLNSSCRSYRSFL